MKFISPRRIAEAQGVSVKTVDRRVAAGLLPPPVAVNMRTRRFAEHEIEAVQRAQLAGKTPDEIKLIIAGLVRQRRQAA